MENKTTNSIHQQLNQKEDTIDIKKFIFKVLSNWYWFVITVALALSITYYINRYTEPVYKVNASILVKDRESSVAGGVENIIQELGLYNRARRKNVENEIGILKSYSLANLTIKKLDFDISYYAIGRIRAPEIYLLSPFVVELDSANENRKNYPVYINILSDKQYRIEINDKYNINKILNFGDRFENDGFSFVVYYNENMPFDKSFRNTKYYFVINDINQLTNRYKSKLNIETTDKKSSVLLLSMQGLVSQKEVDYLNMLCEVYIQSGLDERNQIALNTIKFIDEQLKEITDSLTKVEDRLLNFRQFNQVVDLDKEGVAFFEGLEELQGEKASIVIQLEYYNYLLNYLKNGVDQGDVMAPSVMGVQDPLLNSLVVQLNDLYNEKGVTEYSSTIKNPSLALINIKIENTRLALLENVENIIDGTKISLNSVDARIRKVQNEIQKLPVTEKELLRIERSFNLNNDIYTYLLEKRAEAGIAKASNIADNKILDRAIVENATMISPKKSSNYTIAIIIGLIIPLIIVIIRDFFNDKIIERKDVEDNTVVPIIGTIGHNDKGTDLVVFEKPKSAIAESFRTIRTNLQYLGDSEGDCQVINISSTVSGEGKTFCAVNMATIFALSTKKTLIMGVDLRKPKLHKEFNVTNEIGLSTYLIGKNTKKEIIIQTEIENLDFIPSGPVPPNPAELIDTDKMYSFMEEIKKEYRYIIVDTPPIALVTDALLLNKYACANVFVVRQNYSSKTVLKFVNDLYAEKGLKSLSILINDVKVPSYYGYRTGYGYRYGGYGYSYGYGYGYGYGYYDEDKEKEQVNILTKLLYILRLKK